MSEGDRLCVREAGIFTTVQDQGRFGSQAFGVPISGAMDWLSAEIANGLVGNAPHAALLEITLGKFACVLSRAAWIAVTGADVVISLGGDAVAEPWVPFMATAGEEIRMTRMSGALGMRTYLAAHGGLDLPPVLGSRSTFVAAQLGPMPRPIRAGDELPLGEGTGAPIRSGTPAHLRPRYERSVTARVVLGPQAHRFTQEGIEAFLGAPYTVTPQSDRTGYRLEGARIAHQGAADIISDPIPTGAVQVPGSGQPVLLMADHRVTGGYAKIATVISRDLPAVAQALPGTEIRFESVSVERAHALRLELRTSLGDAGFG